MPLHGSIMTIDAGSPTTVSTSVFEENMTWSRPTTGGSQSNANEALPSRTILYEDHLRRFLRLATTFSIEDKGILNGDREPNGQTIGSNGNNTEETIRHQVETDRTGCACDRLNPGARFGDRDTLLSGASSGSPPYLASNDTDQVAGSGEGSTVDLDDTTAIGVSSTDKEDAAGLRELELLFGLGGIMEDLDGSYNDSLNQSLMVPWNSTHYNDTYIVLGEGLYPSGYTLPHIILASVLATLLMIVIVVGNMLVIIAIATEKALKNIQNWFIASLAVADFFLGLVIMPFSLANEIMGYWIFGYWWCDIYSAMDVLLCTASIMNLCLISLDRFWSITQAVKYLKKRTPARAALMIALVWLLSALVCIPPLLGWKRPTPAEEYPKCKVS
ncbi:PREDICTED: tyramine/octopamine receptor-like [Dufourea novaeangliae]|uniref:Alpha-2C adrenergic receptor n=1 Tax=Dufourea novaeangliae TaxID=178035 RepID=A0A154PH32_DUFNO|nr:PREDICTED: tyramine/octopamine receptor-like [Dufourea novaeangliae]KZC11122.1 Alpha-2C adrenergic receptor [Dufourea novaeangliae]